MGTEGGSEYEIAHRVRRDLGDVMTDEPPFETSTAAAVEDAVRRGRLRRTGRLTLGGVGVIAMAATATMGVVEVRERSVDAPTFQPAAAPEDTPPPEETRTSALPGHDQLIPVLEDVAALAGDTAEVQVAVEDQAGQNNGPGDVEQISVSALVTLPDAGSMQISLSSDPTTDALSRWDESCESGAGDDKPCEVVVRTDETGAWAATYPAQEGREALTYVAQAPQWSLTLRVENYTERSDGSKGVGPSWSEAGLTVDGIDAVVRESGLFG